MKKSALLLFSIAVLSISLSLSYVLIHNNSAEAQNLPQNERWRVVDAGQQVMMYNTQNGRCFVRGAGEKWEGMTYEFHVNGNEYIPYKD